MALVGVELETARRSTTFQNSELMEIINFYEVQ